VSRGRTPKKIMQEELEDTKGVSKGRRPKNDRHKEFEDTKGVLSNVHRRRTDKNTLKMQRGN